MSEIEVHISLGAETLRIGDISRLGALRFKRTDDAEFQEPTGSGVPGFVQLGRLLESTRRIERGEE